MSGEIVSIKHIHDAVPDLVPEPIAWGSYLTVPDTHFLLLSFVNMTDDIPDIDELPRKVAELHQKGLSPNGKFGFPVQNYQGRLSQVTTWADTWEECFANNLKGMLEHEEKTQGANLRLKFLSKSIFGKVIPRLLRPLETGSRQIQARLVHGDLWDGNCSTAVRTNGPVVYDASALYAHNECQFSLCPDKLESQRADKADELAPWRCIRHKIGKPYMRAYHRHFPISAPEEDYDDRNLLYCM
jgi:protein-ribulosamine 3-kinase